MQTIIIDYGARAVIAYACFFLLTKGFAGGLLRATALPYFQEHFGVSLATYHNLYASVLLLPFCLKPVFGVLSDKYPIAGARKRWYITGSMVVTAAACCVLLDATYETAVIAYAAATIGIVCADLLFEASYAEQLREKSTVSGNAIVTWCWGGITLGAAFAAVAAGALADRSLFTPAFGLALLGPVATLAAAAVGYVPEERGATGKEGGRDLVVLGATVAASAVVLLSAIDANSPTNTVLAAVCLSVLVFVVASHVQSSVLVCANFFLFLAEAMNVNYAGATDYFYTSNCGTNPNFDYTFYVTYTLLLGSVFGLVGVAAFRLVEHWPIKTLFASLALVRVLLAGAEVVLAARWNVGYVDDKTFFVFGEAILQPAVSMMFFMPVVILTSKLVRRDMEALTYAILAGTQNFGGLVGAAFGAFFTHHYGIRDCAFEALPLALTVGHMALPLVLVPAAHLLLPDMSVKTKREGRTSSARGRSGPG
jgi:MFS family permease